MNFMMTFHSAITSGTHCDPWGMYKCSAFSVVSVHQFV